MSDILLALESSQPAWIGVCLVFGLLVGSFLNVVIHRLPLMLSREWQQQAREILELAPGETPVNDFGLVHPRSRCPACEAPIVAWQNIPVISYLLLRGRCAHCRTRISARYPGVEIAGGVLAALMAWTFGVSLAALGGMLFAWVLVALTLIDYDHQLLPDDLTLGLLWLGLVFSLNDTFVSADDAIIGAIVGYGSLWLVFQAFKLLTGKEGMGYGDFKLFAALGAWLGWQQLPLVILLASATGAVLGGIAIVLQGRDRAQPIPFGPFLAIAGLIAFLWGEHIVGWYFGLYR